MRKPAFCICENKDADQLHSNYCAAVQRLLYTDSTIPLLPIYENLLWLYSLICVGLVGNPKGRFYINEAHFVILLQLLKACRIKFQKFAAHAHKDALINETFIQT